MTCVLFTSNRNLERAENLKAVYDSYDGDKRFARFSEIKDLHSGRYNLQVTDELPEDTVGKCLFIGHAMGAGKTYGLDQPHPYFRRPELVTYAIASSKEMVPTVAKQIGISESQVFPLGMPRTDAYYKQKRIESTTKQYLYAPTYRGGDWYPNWNCMKMRPDELFIVKPHMVTGRILKGHYQQITEHGCNEPSTDDLVQCDVLITDYSSIMFDAYVMRKPVVLFAKDKKSYLKNRGMYRNYPDQYSELFCDTEDKMLGLVRNAEWDEGFEGFRQFYAGACDGESTNRVIDLIRSMI